MNRETLAVASLRLAKAKGTARSMANATDPRVVEALWGDFVLAVGSFYSKLEGAAKGYGKSLEWLGKRKHERKTDELLLYLHHARNAEEHGVKRITRQAAREVKLAKQGARAEFVRTEHGYELANLSGGATAAFFVTLVRVKDRGQWYEPPKEHRGQPLSDDSPLAVASLAVAYLENMFAEATALASKSG